MCEIPPTERVKQTTRNETTCYGVRLSTKILGRGPGNVQAKSSGNLKTNLANMAMFGANCWYRQLNPLQKLLEENSEKKFD